MDFGSFKKFRTILEETFDHKLVVAEDDPHKDELCMLAGIDIADVVILSGTGCEKFAEIIFGYAEKWLENLNLDSVRIMSVEVSEHGANSAIYGKNNNENGS